MTHKDLHIRHGADGLQQGEQELAPGSSVSLDSTLPPTPLKRLLAADGASIYVFSKDQQLIDTVQHAGGEQYPVHWITDRAELLSVVDMGLCHIVLLDADALGDGVAKLIADLRVFQPSLVVLLAAPRDVAQAHVALLSERSIHRLLIKPVAVGMTRLLLESAVARYLQLREQQPADQLEARLEAFRHRSPAREDTSNSRAPTSMLVIVTSLLAAGVLATSFGLIDIDELRAELRAILSGTSGEAQLEANRTLPSDSVTSEPVATVDSSRANPNGTSADRAEQTAPSDIARDPYGSLLARAEQAYVNGDVFRPIGASALDLYAAVLDQEPAHAAASARLSEIVASLHEQAEAHIEDGRFADAITALAHARRGMPDSERLRALEDELARAQRRERTVGARTDSVSGEGVSSQGTAESDDAVGPDPLDSAPAPAIEPAVPASGVDSTPGASDDGLPASGDAQGSAVAGARTVLDELLERVAQRIEAGRLIEPADDSAGAYLARAEALNPTDARLPALRAELSASAVEQARERIDGGDVDAAARLADFAFRLGADPDVLARLERDVSAARERVADEARSRRLALGRERLRAGQLVTPSGDSALAHLSAVRIERPTFPGLEAPWNALLNAITAEVRAAIEAERWGEATQWVEALAASRAAPRLVESLRNEMLVARRQAAFLREPVPAGELELLESVPPQYPSAALRRGLEGWVELVYTVGADGRPSDIAVREAAPRGLFEDAARASVATHVYRPTTIDGQTYARRVWLRVRFTLR